MSSEKQELADWCRKEREEAERQIDFFAPDGVKAMLHMPDGTTQDITESVVRHQRENVEMLGRIAAALD